MRIFIGGITGIGKSYFAKQLAETLGKPYFAISASQIIRKGIKTEDKYKILTFSNDLATKMRNRILIEFLKKNSDVILDGHFTIRFNGELTIVFDIQLTHYIDLFIILMDSVENVKNKRSLRKNRLDILDSNLIQEELVYERLTAEKLLFKDLDRLIILDYSNTLSNNLNLVTDFINKIPF